MKSSHTYLHVLKHYRTRMYKLGPFFTMHVYFHANHMVVTINRVQVPLFLSVLSLLKMHFSQTFSQNMDSNEGHSKNCK